MRPACAAHRAGEVANVCTGRDDRRQSSTVARIHDAEYALADGALRLKSKIDGGTKTDLALFKDAVIYGEEGGNIVALGARSGEPKWKFKTKKRCLSPLVAGETVYPSCADNHLYAIDPQTGQMKWKYDWKKNAPLPMSPTA